MRKLTTRQIAGIGALIVSGAAAAAAVAPSAHADPDQDYQFGQLLANHQLHSPNGVTGMKQAALAVCDKLDSMPTTAYSGAAVAQYVQANNPALSIDDAQWFTAISVVVYCPWNDPTTHGTSAPAQQGGTTIA